MEDKTAQNFMSVNTMVLKNRKIFGFGLPVSGLYMLAGQARQRKPARR